MMYISIGLILFFYAKVVEMTSHSHIIIQTAESKTSDIDIYDKSIRIHDNGCECIKYNCGCCQFMELDAVFLNGTLCANASYLDHDYGISITITYNDFTIINETVSARNPPPICVGEGIVDAIEVEVCLNIYDIDIDSDKFHVCFEIFGRILKFRISKLKLGCIDKKILTLLISKKNTNISNNSKKNTNNNASILSFLLYQKKYAILFSIIIVILNRIFI